MAVSIITAAGGGGGVLFVLVPLPVLRVWSRSWLPWSSELRVIALFAPACLLVVPASLPSMTGGVTCHVPLLCCWAAVGLLVGYARAIGSPEINMFWPAATLQNSSLYVL